MLIHIQSRCEQVHLMICFVLFVLFSFLLDSDVVDAYIDGTDEKVEGTFVTSKDGSPLIYTNFYYGQPDNYGAGQDCIVMSFYDGKWKDIEC